MKKLATLIVMAGLATFQACTGPEGPMGAEGPEGLPGINILGTTYEVEIDFTEGNDYTDVFNFPNRLEESDAVLVYRLVRVDNNRDIWRQLPQTYFFQEGVLMYNFDYTVTDFAIFLDGPIDFASLPDQWSQNQIFRVIVVPSDFPTSRIDFSNYEEVTKMLGISDEDFQKVERRK